MSEEEKATLEFIKINNKHRYCDKNDVDFLLNLIEKQQKELNNIKEIEKSHKEENGKLRVELEQEKEKNNDLETDYILCAMDRKNHYVSKDKIKELLENEIIDISGFRCIAVEDIENLLEDK